MIRKIHDNKFRLFSFIPPILLIFFTLTLSQIGSKSNPISADAGPPVRRVNMPFLGEEPPAELFEPAIFWLGKVDPTTNYADVRVWYFGEYMKLFVNVIDRLLWYDKDPTSSELSQWDAVSIYLDLDGNVGSAPGKSSFLLIGQLNAPEPREKWQAAYQGNGTSWELIPMSFTTTRELRGAANDNKNDKGWGLAITIPFDSLGLSGPPPKETVWGLGVSLHDRDSLSGSPAVPDQIWPEQFDSNKPSTWGQLHFGRSSYEPPDMIPSETLEIRNKFNGVSVTDAHVGGSFGCGGDVDHWSEWGEANYAGSTQINIQNQWDISDYPCFSKFYITFPLESIPSPEGIISAKLTMNRFSNSGGGSWGEPPDSYIHALTIGEDWDEATLSWNNAPLALENITGTWVEPRQTTEQRQYSWDVTKAVIEAKETGEPIRLALYSIDGDRHSGKYFWSSDSNDWGGTVRPRLLVTLGGTSPSPSPTPQPSPCETQGVECNYIFVPNIQR